MMQYLFAGFKSKKQGKSENNKKNFKKYVDFVIFLCKFYNFKGNINHIINQYYELLITFFL